MRHRPSGWQTPPLGQSVLTLHEHAASRHASEPLQAGPAQQRSPSAPHGPASATSASGEAESTGPVLGDLPSTTLPESIFEGTVPSSVPPSPASTFDINARPPHPKTSTAAPASALIIRVITPTLRFASHAAACNAMATGGPTLGTGAATAPTLSRPRCRRTYRGYHPPRRC